MIFGYFKFEVSHLARLAIVFFVTRSSYTIVNEEVEDEKDKDEEEEDEEEDEQKYVEEENQEVMKEEISGG